jgi:protein-arginine kinase
MDRNLLSDKEIPIGLGMALAQNVHSMKYFTSLDKESQQQIIDQTHNIRSKAEMQQFVSSFGKENSIGYGGIDTDRFM